MNPSSASGAPPLCWLDGRLLPLDQARISPLDRGFLFGDAVYEAVKLIASKPLFLAAHLERLGRSVAALRIPLPPEIERAIAELLAAIPPTTGALYFQVTRGVGASRRHLPQPGLTPTLFLMPIAIDYPAEPWTLPGLAAVTRPDDRWAHRDVKTTALAASVLGKLVAADCDADEVLFVGADGALREGGNTNLFVRDRDGWRTHPLGAEILAGVTRGLVIEALRAAALPLAEIAPAVSGRAGWREACLTGTVTGVRGLVRLDGAPIGDGEVGPETRQLARALAATETRALSR